MSTFRTLVLAVAFALPGASAAASAEEDLIACGRGAVEAGVGSGQIDDYVARCVSDRRTARGESSVDGDRKGGKDKTAQKAKDKMDKPEKEKKAKGKKE